MSAELVLDCPRCAGPRLFEQPPGPDGYGIDCPELACVECGFALIRGSAVPSRPAERTAARAA